MEKEAERLWGLLKKLANVFWEGETLCITLDDFKKEVLPLIESDLFRWVPVGEPPKYGEHVLLKCWSQSLGQFIHHQGFLASGRFYFWNGEIIDSHSYVVKGWQSLPKTPKEAA